MLHISKNILQQIETKPYSIAFLLSHDTLSHLPKEFWES